MDYYSITISIICVVDDGVMPEDGYTQDIQVHIVKASSFENAFSQALSIGKSEEHSYKNSDGDTVFWKFKEIEYVRKLGAEVTKVEISTRLEGYLSKEVFNKSTDFKPEMSQPINDDESNT